MEILWHRNYNADNWWLSLSRLKTKRQIFFGKRLDKKLDELIVEEKAFLNPHNIECDKKDVQ